MLPRRRSKNTTPSYASQQQAGSSVDGGRRPDLVTNKVPHRGPTAQTLITESPVSESSPLEPPPPILMPPRAIPPLPSRRPTPFPSGPFRRTVESYDSTSEPTSPQPESGPAHRETAGVSEGIRETASVSEGIHAGVWPTYNKVSQEFDEKWLKQWNEDLDVLLIFVSLSVGVAIHSVELITIRRPRCSPQSSRPSSSGLSTIWVRIINNSRSCSSISC